MFVIAITSSYMILFVLETTLFISRLLGLKQVRRFTQSFSTALPHRLSAGDGTPGPLRSRALAPVPLRGRGGGEGALAEATGGFQGFQKLALTTVRSS